MLQYRSMERHNPHDLDAPKKFYALPVPTKKLTQRELVEEISFATAINGTSVSAVIESLIEMLPRHLGDGKLIQFGDFGSFRLTISSEGVDNPDLVNSACIKKVNILFRPGKVLKAKLDGLTFEKIN